MPTKTEYRAYIASPGWQARRKEFLCRQSWCNRCEIPRWLAIIAYDQDLHVHHKNYENVGQEKNEDLEPLCRRCHEVETFGSSKLHKPQQVECIECGQIATWDMTTRLCPICLMVATDWESVALGAIAKRGLGTVLGLIGDTVDYDQERKIKALTASA